MEKKITNVLCFVLTIFPILNQYRSVVPGITLGELLIIIMLPFLLYYLKIKKDKRWIPFLFIVLLLVLLLFFLLISACFVNKISYGNALLGILRLTFYFSVVFLCINSIFNIDLFFNIYTKFSLLSTLYLIIQFFAHNWLNVDLPWTIPFLTVYQENYGAIDFATLFVDFYRPYSFFLEPGYYVQYVLPYLVLVLFIKRYRSLRKAIFITFGLVFSTSGQGLIIGLIIWILYMVIELKKSPSVFVGAGALLFVIVKFIKDIPFVERSLIRLFGSEGASSNSRIFEPFSYYWDLDIQNKIFGIGYNNVLSIIGNVYLNSISYILITSGILGFLLVLMFLIACFILFKRMVSKVLLLIFCILLLVSGIFTTPNTIFYLVIIFGTELSKGKKMHGEFN